MEQEKLEKLQENKNKILELMREDMHQIAQQRYSLNENSGKINIDTDNASWILKHEKGQMEYLFFEKDMENAGDLLTKRGTEVNIHTLIAASKDYENFINRYKELIKEQHEDIQSSIENIENLEIFDISNLIENTKEMKDLMKSKLYDVINQQMAINKNNDKLEISTGPNEKWKLKWTYINNQIEIESFKYNDEIILSRFNRSYHFDVFIKAVKNFHKFIEKYNDEMLKANEILDEKKQQIQ